MDKLNPCFKTIVDYVVENKATMPPEVKTAIATKCRNILVRMDEPIEAPEPKNKKESKGGKA